MSLGGGLGPLPSLQVLGTLNFAAAAASQGPITIPAKKVLIIEYVITGYSGADVGMFQINADTTATNYGSGFSATSAALANATAPAFGSAVVNAGTTAGIPVSGITQTVGRRGVIRISNQATSRKVCVIHNQNESTTTAPPIAEITAWGEWINVTAQITQIKMLTKGGLNLNAGSGCVIFGYDF